MARGKSSKGTRASSLVVSKVGVEPSETAVSHRASLGPDISAESKEVLSPEFSSFPVTPLSQRIEGFNLALVDFPPLQSAERGDGECSATQTYAATAEETTLVKIPCDCDRAVPAAPPTPLSWKNIFEGEIKGPIKLEHQELLIEDEKIKVP